MSAAAAKELEQVVVIGYGTANKRDLTGSIVKILEKKLRISQTQIQLHLLQSKVAGLSVVNNGTPGAAPDIRIRGTVSIGQVHPLYVVDGVFEDNIDFLNPNDIESIEILKDPSSLPYLELKELRVLLLLLRKKQRLDKLLLISILFTDLKNLLDKIKMVNADSI